MDRLVAVTAKIHADSRAALIELARREERSVSAVVRRAVSRLLKTDHAMPPKR
jgi:hypothetical protein